jgi:hypothetical protein
VYCRVVGMIRFVVFRRGGVLALDLRDIVRNSLVADSDNSPSADMGVSVVKSRLKISSDVEESVVLTGNKASTCDKSHPGSGLAVWTDGGLLTVESVSAVSQLSTHSFILNSSDRRTFLDDKSGAAASDVWVDEASSAVAHSVDVEVLISSSCLEGLASLLLISAVGVVKMETSAIDMSSVTPSEHELPSSEASPSAVSWSLRSLGLTWTGELYGYELATGLSWPLLSVFVLSMVTCSTTSLSAKRDCAPLRDFPSEREAA